MGFNKMTKWTSVLGALCLGFSAWAQTESPSAGWGVDAGVSWAVSVESVPEWLALLKQSEVRLLRERGVWGNGSRRTEEGGQKAEDGGRKTEGGGRRTVEGEISAEVRAR